MGYMADYYRAQAYFDYYEMLCEADALRECLVKGSPIYWKTIDGRSILVTDIEDQHLKNIYGMLCMVNNPNDLNRAWREVIEAEHKRRGMVAENSSCPL